MERIVWEQETKANVSSLKRKSVKLWKVREYLSPKNQNEGFG